MRVGRRGEEFTREEFEERLPNAREVARESSDEELISYYDNGTQVGTWRENLRTKDSHGEIFTEVDSALARSLLRGKGQSR
jgi:hypothetical protein